MKQRHLGRQWERDFFARLLQALKEEHHDWELVPRRAHATSSRKRDVLLVLANRANSATNRIRQDRDG